MSRPAQFYNEYWAELCRVVRRKFGAGPPDPEEVAQAAFERLTLVSQTEDILNPRAFLHRCAKNYVLNQRRHQAVQSRYAEEYIALNDEQTPDEFDAQRVLEAKERLAIVLRTVDGMEEKRRKILLMRQIDELTFDEIARRMALSHTRVVQLFAEAVVLCARASKATDVETSSPLRRGAKT